MDPTEGTFVLQGNIKRLQERSGRSGAQTQSTLMLTKLQVDANDTTLIKREDFGIDAETAMKRSLYVETTTESLI